MKSLVIGEKYSRLTAIAQVSGPVWRFHCVCGNEIERRKYDVLSGNTKSCGCLRRDVVVKRNMTRDVHEDQWVEKHPLWHRYQGMIARCTNENHPGYAHYGGRGITVCDRWLESFENFVADMGECPEGMTLERRDNDKGYSKENCVWATRARQSRNTSRNRLIEFGGVTLPMRDMEIRLGFKKGTLQRRLDLGWSVEDACSLPVNPGKPLRKRK